MKSNFYEKIISFKDENEKIKINKMSQLLDESIGSFIEFRKRNLDELNNADIKVKIINKDNEFEAQRNILSFATKSNDSINNIKLELIERITFNPNSKNLMNCKKQKENRVMQLFLHKITYGARKCYKSYKPENDTLEKVLEKYQVSKEELAKYNNLDEIHVGDKLIIPTSNNDK